MTAEIDALRLVPEDRDIVANLRQGANDLHPYFVGDTDKIEADCALPAYLNDAADEIERLRAMLASAPAVQPAAGREEIARALDLLNEARRGGFFIGASAGAKVEEAKDVLRDILAALSQPGPASEGDGE